MLETIQKVWRTRSQMAERLGNRASNQKVAGSISGHANYIVSLGKALQLPRDRCPCTDCKSLWIRAFAK